MAEREQISGTQTQDQPRRYQQRVQNGDRDLQTRDRDLMQEDEGGEPEGKKAGLFARKPYLRVVLGLIALLLIVGVILFYIHSRHWEDTDDAQVDGHIYNISPRVSGHVTKVYYDDNQLVQAGAALVEIDPSDYQIALENAKANYQDLAAQAAAAQSGVPLVRSNAQTSIAGAEVDVTNSIAQVDAAKKQADAARAQLAQAQAAAVKANSDVQRYQQLVKKQEISQQLFDTAVTTAQSANAAVVAAQANVLSADQQVNVAIGRLSQARSNLANARVSPVNVRVTAQKATAADAAAQRGAAAVRQAQLNLDYTKLVSPVTGVVGHRSVEPGHNVSIGQMLMSVVPLDDLWITANFKETQMHHMFPGQRVKIHIDALSKDIEGTVDSLGAATGAVFSLLPPENATGNYVKVVQRIPVKITYKRDQDPDQRLRPGMSVEANVNVQ
jgi:membrane fusion protein (multidrug efflux system)